MGPPPLSPPLFSDALPILATGATLMLTLTLDADSQSWFHSQEVNVMIDSRQLVAEMTDTLLSNQNTMKYGLVGTDGVWRDDEGKTLQHYGATGSGRFRGLSALVRIIKSV